MCISSISYCFKPTVTPLTLVTSNMKTEDSQVRMYQSPSLTGQYRAGECLLGQVKLKDPAHFTHTDEMTLALPSDSCSPGVKPEKNTKN